MGSGTQITFSTPEAAMRRAATLSTTPLRITSPQNEQIKVLVRLCNRRERDQQQVTLIEEPLVISRALAEGYPLRTVNFCPENLREQDSTLLVVAPQQNTN